MTVQEAAAKIGCSAAVLRSGIVQGKLPGVAIPCGEKTKFVIPDKAVELFLCTGIPTALLAEQIMSADCPEQALAMIRKVITGEDDQSAATCR